MIEIDQRFNEGCCLYQPFKKVAALMSTDINLNGGGLTKKNGQAKFSFHVKDWRNKLINLLKKKQTQKPGSGAQLQVSPVQLSITTFLWTQLD